MTTAALLLGTNTASIVRRIDIANWVVAAQAPYSPGGMKLVFNLTPIPDKPNNVWSWTGTRNAGEAAPQTYSTSTDSGTTWSLVTWTGSGPIYKPAHAQQISNFTNSISFSRDRMGRVFVAGVPEFDPAVAHNVVVMRLDGYAGTDPPWLEIAGSPMFTIRPTWAGDGYVWFIHGGGATFELLNRANYDGTNWIFFLPGLDPPTSASNFAGKARSRRLYMYSPIFKSNTTLASPPIDIYSIDITNPDNPIATKVPAAFGGEICDYIEITSHDIAYAYTTQYVFPAVVGSIWKTTNGGITWTRILGPDASLGIAQQSTFFNNIVYSSISAIDDDEVWVAGLYPYVFHTIDGGLNWATETYNGPVLPPPQPSGTGDTGNYSWTCILAIPPVQARRIPQVTLVGAT